MQGRVSNHRPEIAEQAKFGTHAQQAFFRTLLCGVLVPFGATHRTEQDGISLATGGDGGRWQRVAGGINGSAADQLLIELDVDGKLLADHREHFFCRGIDFYTYTVSGQGSDPESSSGYWHFHNG